VVAALHSPSGLAGRLDGGEQEADENADDGNHHQQFDKRESVARGRVLPSGTASGAAGWLRRRKRVHRETP
jgi:hypothetical protein